MSLNPFPRSRLVPVWVALVAMLPLACNLPPGTASVTFTWEEPITSQVYLWMRVETRASIDAPGTVLDSAGPLPYTPGLPFVVPLGSVAHGTDRVVVVEVREGDSPGLRIRWFGLSEPFSVAAGQHTEVPVFLQLQKPESEREGAFIALRFGDAEPAVVTETDARAATLRMHVVPNTEAVVLANDASFSANLRKIDLKDGPSMTCTTTVVDGTSWKDCDSRAGTCSKAC